MGRQRYTPAQQAFYVKYMRSKAWKEKRDAKIRMVGGCCEFETMTWDGGFKRVRCGRTRYLEVHHNTYVRLSNEMWRDLDVFCWFHHQIEHLLWKRCRRCMIPCLQNDEAAEKWFQIVLSTMQIDLDSGPVNWSNLPNKEIFLDQIPDHCPGCAERIAPLE